MYITFSCSMGSGSQHVKYSPSVSCAYRESLPQMEPSSIPSQFSTLLLYAAFDSFCIYCFPRKERVWFICLPSENYSVMIIQQHRFSRFSCKHYLTHNTYWQFQSWVGNHYPLYAPGDEIQNPLDEESIKWLKVNEGTNSPWTLQTKKFFRRCPEGPRTAT